MTHLITLDFETYWSQTHSLSKMNPLAYVMHEDTEVISVAIKQGDAATQVYFGGEVAPALAAIDWSKSACAGHNLSGFDAFIAAWRYGINPRLWLCTLALARPIYAKTVGLSLAKLVEHLGLGVKDATALHDTKGKRLADFTPAEVAAMRVYNRADTDQCHALLQHLLPHYSSAELWHLDATIRMATEPKLVVDVPLLETALSVERDHKRKHILQLARHMREHNLGGVLVREAQSIEGIEEAVRAELASAPKFSALLESLGVPVPTKPSPSDETKRIPALAKTDQAFLDLQESDNPIVATAAQARLAIKSTLLETRIQTIIDTSAVTGGVMPNTLHYCGADTTGRWSGWLWNGQNLPRIGPTPKTSDALRRSLRAPKGHALIAADLSGIELRVNHFLWQVPESMALFQADPEADLYRARGAERFNCTPEAVSKAQRQLMKIEALGLQFGSGALTFQRVAKVMGGLDLSDEEAQVSVAAWRAAHGAIVQGWRTCADALHHIHAHRHVQVDPWGLVATCAEGFRLPSGRFIRYPALHQEPKPGTDGRGFKDMEWWYGLNRHRSRIYGSKSVENIIQSLARDVIADAALAFWRDTKLRPVLSVHDELVYVVPEGEAESLLAHLQHIMRTPPTWWPQLITWSEGAIATHYGDCK